MLFTYLKKEKENSANTHNIATPPNEKVDHDTEDKEPLSAATHGGARVSFKDVDMGDAEVLTADAERKMSMSMSS